MTKLTMVVIMLVTSYVHGQSTEANDHTETIVSSTTLYDNRTSAQTGILPVNSNSSVLTTQDLTSSDLTTTPLRVSSTTSTLMKTTIIGSQYSNSCRELNSPFECASGDECIPRRDYCNLTPQCRDKSDERSYSDSIQEQGIECIKRTSNSAKKCFLPQKYVCDHELDCTLGEDECDCANHSMQCEGLPSYIGGLRSKQCIVRTQFCDNVQNCYDNSDEKKYSRGASGYQCAVTKTRVTTYCMLPMVNACDGIADCDGATDECFCDASGTNVIENIHLNDRCFRCLDGSLVIPRKQFCDNTLHCPDLSDECLCSGNTPAICDQVCRVGKQCGRCMQGEVECKKGLFSSSSICISPEKVCDGNYDCPRREDEKNCNIDVSKLFNCTDGRMYIAKHFRCDNKTDCKDGSDEEFCGELFFQCSEYYKTYDFARPRYAVKCDKIPTCEDLEDECNKTLCGEDVPSYCKYVRGRTGFICPNNQAAIIGTEICDGFPTCFVSSPNSSADEFDCPGRVYCKNNGSTGLPIHIPPSSKCDGVSDCIDESDEMDCPEESHYYCSNGSPHYLPRSKVCNGIQDCSNGEDECQNCSTSPFSSDEFLINSYVLQVFIWIIGLFAVIGNAGVLIHNMRLWCRGNHSFSVVALNHRILVTNLAVADLLLGVYLVGLGIVNSTYKGIYCRKDIQWRTSSSCVAIGTIAVVSIECSVFLLSIMATMRLFLVTRPLNFRMHRRYIVLGVVLAWFVSLVLALVPLAESQMDYFTSQVWYQNNPLLTIANRKDVQRVSTFFWALTNGNSKFSNIRIGSLSWNNMLKTITHLDKSFVPSLYLGYYSAHGVCLPRVFPDPSADRSWGFSTFLITLNFLVFAYMLCAYIAIYRVTIKNSRRAGTLDSEETGLALQHKISRIIFTNFCCWVPICIMAFISAGGGFVSQEAYAVSAVILLPINSAFNPLLYSDLPELVWGKFFAKTKFGKWVESKQYSRRESRRRKSRASSLSASALRQTELTRFQVNTIKNSSQSQDDVTKIMS